MNYKRTERKRKQNSIAHYDGLEANVREEAKKNFKRKPYQIVSVAHCMAKNYGIGGNTDGQEDS